MSNVGIDCRKGDTCRFVIDLREPFPSGVPAEYDEAKLQVREAGDETLTALLSVTHADGITIDHSAQPYTNSEGETCRDDIVVQISAVQTEQLPTFQQPRKVFAQLRLYASADAANRISWEIPNFVLQPDGIDD